MSECLFTSQIMCLLVTWAECGVIKFLFVKQAFESNFYKLTLNIGDNLKLTLKVERSAKKGFTNSFNATSESPSMMIFVVSHLPNMLVERS